MRAVQVKLWDPLRMCAIPEPITGVFTTRCYTNPCLPFTLTCMFFNSLSELTFCEQTCETKVYIISLWLLTEYTTPTELWSFVPVTEFKIWIAWNTFSELPCGMRHMPPSIAGIFSSHFPKGSFWKKNSSRFHESITSVNAQHQTTELTLRTNTETPRLLTNLFCCAQN